VIERKKKNVVRVFELVVDARKLYHGCDVAAIVGIECKDAVIIRGVNITGFCVGHDASDPFKAGFRATDSVDRGKRDAALRVRGKGRVLVYAGVRSSPYVPVFVDRNALRPLRSADRQFRLYARAGCIDCDS
jgi:hypothetical protein